MNVRTVCLAILHEGDATGYEIRRLCVEGECSYFLEASFGSIYPALAKLEDENLVTSHVEQQGGKPSKKVYSITPAGRAAFIEELSEPLGEEMFRSPFLLFARFAHLLPSGLVEARLHEHLQRKLDTKKTLCGIIGDNGIDAAEAWVVNYGLAMMEASERYLRSNMEELITLSRAESAHKDAAE